MVNQSPTYLPQLSVEAHASIFSTASRTTITQRYRNPSSTQAIDRVRYVFPLYDGVSVVAFKCRIGERVIEGVVKEKREAKKEFDRAVASGQTAGLLEQSTEASDTFTTRLGNVPAGAEVLVEITYVGELKHDIAFDGIRFTIPTVIAPRYGSGPPDTNAQSYSGPAASGMKITADICLESNAVVREVSSPSHPISVSIGTISTSDDASLSKASATLSLGETSLDQDFVLQIKVKDPQVPRAMLETHPEIAGQKALMTTLVPRFTLPANKPEIVFVCDRSGSMSGSPIKKLAAAVQVFLKSLPVGCFFNICSFGSSYSFLWERSKAYSAETLEEAVRHVSRFEADMGGTEMLNPIRETVSRRYLDRDLEILIQTDGEIWNQDNLFGYLNGAVSEAKTPIRVFSLGIGNAVSHSLIEGLARAGNGIAQTVGLSEPFEGKIVRMLKAALLPHVSDYTLEIKYHDDDDPEDFELIEKVEDCLKVTVKESSGKAAGKTEVCGSLLFATQTSKFANILFPQEKKPISLFDTTVNISQDMDAHTSEGNDLPTIVTPTIIQAPQRIPTLFPFIRTSVFLLLSPQAPQKSIKSVVLRAKSKHGPLELEIPVDDVGTGKTLHQLAAKRAIADLEEGRGWLIDAQEGGQLLKQKYESRFEELVKSEAIRLGVDFQISSKNCSWVAVQKDGLKESYVEPVDPDMEVDKKFETEEDDDECEDMGFGLYDVDSVASSSPPPPPAYQTREVQLQCVAKSGEMRKRAAAPLRGMDAVFSLGNSIAKKSASLRKSSPPMAEQALPKAKSSSGIFGRRQGFSFSDASSQQRSSEAANAPTMAATPFGSSAPGSTAFGSTNAFPAPAPKGGFGVTSLFGSSGGEGGGGRGGAVPGSAPKPSGGLFSSTSTTSSGLFGSTSTTSGGLFGSKRSSSGSLLGSTPSSNGNLPGSTPSSGGLFSSLSSSSSGLFGAPSAPIPPRPRSSSKAESSMSPAPPFQPVSPVPSAPPVVSLTPTIDTDERLRSIISLQGFAGSWKVTPALSGLLGIDHKAVVSAAEQLESGTLSLSDGATKDDVWATVAVILFFEEKMPEKKDSWELVVEKALSWLEGSGLDVEREDKTKTSVWNSVRKAMKIT